jgi:hypothetical protein
MVTILAPFLAAERLAAVNLVLDFRHAESSTLTVVKVCGKNVSARRDRNHSEPAAAMQADIAI